MNDALSSLLSMLQKEIKTLCLLLNQDQSNMTAQDYDALNQSHANKFTIKAHIDDLINQIDQHADLKQYTGSVEDKLIQYSEAKTGMASQDVVRLFKGLQHDLKQFSTLVSINQNIIEENIINANTIYQAIISGTGLNNNLVYDHQGQITPA